MRGEWQMLLAQAPFLSVPSIIFLQKQYLLRAFSAMERCLCVLLALGCVWRVANVAGDGGTCGVKCLKDESCDGQLACMHNACGDDPSMHTNICSAGAPNSSGKDGDKSHSKKDGTSSSADDGNVSHGKKDVSSTVDGGNMSHGKKDGTSSSVDDGNTSHGKKDGPSSSVDDGHTSHGKKDGPSSSVDDGNTSHGKKDGPSSSVDDGNTSHGKKDGPSSSVDDGNMPHGKKDGASSSVDDGKKDGSGNDGKKTHDKKNCSSGDKKDGNGSKKDGSTDSNGDEDGDGSGKSQNHYGISDIIQLVTEFISKGGNLGKLYSMVTKMLAKLKCQKQEGNNLPAPTPNSPVLPPPVTPPPVPPAQGGGECKQKSEMKGSGQKCNKENNSECCESGKSYQQYDCSPPVTQQTPAILTLNSFEAGGDGGGASECDGKFHSNSQLVVAISTGWFSQKRSCGAVIRIATHAGKTADATVVDECDSMHGCDKDHDFQPPCRNNVVDASQAVWAQLGIGKGSPEYGQANVTWYFLTPSPHKS